MILEIDAGNSRVKWRVIEDGHQKSIAEGSVNAMSEYIAEGMTESDLVINVLAAVWEAGLPKEITRVRVSSVRGKEFQANLTDLVSSKWSLAPEYASVEKSCGGVKNAYAAIDTMGVDRWLAMLSAYNRVAGSCCVIDCGSAITFDWINQDGVHQGGYIVPGFHLMQSSLAQKSTALKLEIDGWSSCEPGKNTRDCISRGIVSMVGGFAGHCFRHVSEAARENNEGNTVHWFFTGGDAELVSKHIPWPHQVEKDLVLEGLVVALP